MPTRAFVIAEVAACHDGDLTHAIKLVDLAADIGADAVKFQYLSNAQRLCDRRNAPTYLASYKLLELPRAWLDVLSARCARLGIEFMATCYLEEDIATIEPYVQRFKVASFENQDHLFINAHRPYGKPIIVSCGMGGDPPYDTHRLICTSAYPAPVEEMNLRRLHSGEYEGLSDHTTHPWTGALAVAAGAQIIEFHLRLNETSPANADYHVARPPRAAADYVANIRLAEAMMGDGLRRVAPSEGPMLRYRVMV